MLELPLATAEFLAVDTETNGLPGDRCELTEVGAVLVGGGELHDEFQSLVGVASPLGRGIQRFTGISQAMVDAAPPPEQILPHFAAQLRGRVLVAHNARFDTRVLQQAFARAALDWPDPPVVCTVALARRFAPLQRRRGLSALAAALGIEVDTVHRALPDARTCARVFCALFGRLCAHAPTVGEALALLHPRKARRAKPPPAARRPAGRAAAPRRAPARARRLRVPRRGRARALRGQVGRPAHARAGPLHLRRGLDRAGRARGPPADGVRARGAAAGGPAHQVAAPPGQHARQGGAGRLRLPALPAGHPVPDPRGGARARPRARGLRRAAAGPRRDGRADGAAQLAVRPAPLRPHAAAARAPVGLRPDGPLPLALPARSGSQRLSRAPGRRARPVLGRRRQRAADPRGRAGRRGVGRPALRARRLAAAPPQPAGGAARAARRPPAGDPHRHAARSSPRTRATPGASTRCGSPAAG